MGSGVGAQVVLNGSVNPQFPFSYAETPGGMLLLANGIDPMQKWDGLSPTMEPAGIIPPAAAPALAGLNYGSITGFLVAYVRFLDDYGNCSNLSPISNILAAGFDGNIDQVNYNSTSGQVTVTSFQHGLTGTQTILISGVNGLTLVNGQWSVTVVDANTFTISGLVITSGQYTDGGYWTQGVASLVYSDVPTPVDGKVVRRQILRNLSGNLETLYVDIDTNDITSTVFGSAQQDDVLSGGTPVPLTYGDADLPFANANGVPPSHKTVIASHKGSIFAAADASYSVGHAQVAFNSVVVQGVQTAWQTTMVGRLFYFDGAQNTYEIAAVNEATQQATLSTPFVDNPSPYCLYTIRPNPGERRLIYYSEPGLPESWPAYNAIAVPEDEDQIIGIVSLGQYLYIIENRHIYRLTYQSDPASGMTFLVSHRGALSNRSYAETDQGMFMMDEVGVHLFDGEHSEPISAEIQNVFQGDGTSNLAIDWNQDQSLWHAAWDPIRTMVRFFVQMQGYDSMVHGICYNYMTKRWWIEQYPTAILCSANATIGARRCLVGTEARRVLCLSEGNYDGVDGSGWLTGTCTSATSTTLTDTAASFEDVEGVSLTITAGTGVGQTAMVATNSDTTLTIVGEWGTTPDSTSVYQIAGIPWEWRTGWFRYLDEEESNSRDVDLTFKPLTIPGNIQIQLYYDHSSEPRVWNRTISQDGVSTVDGSPLITVDLEGAVGWARQRLTGHGDAYAFNDRFISVDLSGVQAGQAVRVSQLVIDGVED